MAALKIDELLGNVRSRVQFVGVELEGGWLELPAGVALHRDGSVSIPRPRDPADPNRDLPLSIGEIPSEPMELIKLKPWLKKFYPSHVNKSCGMHVHMSFALALHYHQLMIPEYQETIVKYLKEWGKDEKLASSHPIWSRLAGENSFCRLEFYADMQARQTNKNYSNNGQAGSRYTAINYCFGQHETIECRVLPMMADWELAYKAIRRVLDITNACLVVTAKKNRRQAGKMEVGYDEDPVISHRSIML